MAPGSRSKFGAPMFEPELFRKKIQRIEVSTCDIFRTFRRPILTQRPGNCTSFSPSVTPLVALLSQIDRVLLPHIWRLFHLQICLHKFVKFVTSSVLVRNVYIEQMFVSVRIQFHNHVDTQPVKRLRGVCDVYRTSKLECCMSAKALVVLRSCTPQWNTGHQGVCAIRQRQWT